MINFKVDKVKYNKKNFHPYRTIKFKWTPEMAQDITSLSSFDSKKLLLKDFEKLIDDLTNGKYN